jgi:hypothetical protein
MIATYKMEPIRHIWISHDLTDRDSHSEIIHISVEMLLPQLEVPCIHDIVIWYKVVTNRRIWTSEELSTSTIVSLGATCYRKHADAIAPELH